MGPLTVDDALVDAPHAPDALVQRLAAVFPLCRDREPYLLLWVTWIWKNRSGGEDQRHHTLLVGNTSLGFLYYWDCGSGEFMYFSTRAGAQRLADRYSLAKKWAGHHLSGQRPTFMCLPSLRPSPLDRLGPGRDGPRARVTTGALLRARGAGALSAALCMLATAAALTAGRRTRRGSA